MSKIIEFEQNLTKLWPKQNKVSFLEILKLLQNLSNSDVGDGDGMAVLVVVVVEVVVDVVVGVMMLVALAPWPNPAPLFTLSSSCLACFCRNRFQLYRFV